MSKFFGKRAASNLMMAAAGAVGLMGIAQQAGATLTVDVRGPSSSKSVTASVGQVITLQVYAQVAGANSTGDDDWLQSLYGTFATTGTVKGNMAGGVYTTYAWNGNGSQNGVPGDYLSDGDTDLGNPTDYTQMFFARNNSPEGPSLDIQTDDNGDLLRLPRWHQVGANPGDNEIRIGTITYTVTGGSGVSTVNFARRNAQEGALWWEDDASSLDTTGPTSSGTSQKDGLSGVILAGTPFTINVASVPEPASLSVLALASLGLLKRRRRETV